MDEKPVFKIIPLKQIKVKPIYSTLREHAMLYVGFFTLTLAGYCGRLVALTQIYSNIRGLVLPEEAILIGVGGLVYLLFYKRYNYRFLAEDGLYYVRKDLATHIPWEMIKSAKVVHRSVWSYIQVDVVTDPSTM